MILDFGKVHRHVHDVIAAIAPNDSKERFNGLGVRVIAGAARFADRDTVASVDAHPIDLDRTHGRHQIKVARRARRIFCALAGLQRGGKHARIGTDRQRAVIVSRSTRGLSEQMPFDNRSGSIGKARSGK